MKSTRFVQAAVGLTVVVGTSAWAGTPAAQCSVSAPTQGTAAEATKAGLPAVAATTAIDQALRSMSAEERALLGKRPAATAQLDTYVCPEGLKILLM
jgi:hypothetical protein